MNKMKTEEMEVAPTRQLEIPGLIGDCNDAVEGLYDRLSALVQRLERVCRPPFPSNDKSGKPVLSTALGEELAAVAKKIRFATKVVSDLLDRLEL